MCVVVILQLIESSQEGQSVGERIFSRIMTNYEATVKPENGQPREPLKIDFGFAVFCAEFDQSDGLLKTNGWQFMVRETNREWPK